MTILVTGGAGYIGSHTVLSLLSYGKNVVVLDNLSNSSSKSLERVEKICGRRPLFYHGDVRDRKKLKHIFQYHDITDVIHFAGLKAVAESVSNPLEYYDHNVNGTIVLLEEMMRAGVISFIFSSSATVYGKPETIPLKEDSSVGGTTNPYGFSKLIVERVLKDIALAEPTMRITILRYFNPVGAHSSGLLGEDPNGVPNNLIPYITQVAIGNLKYLSVFGNDYPTPDGTGIRDYIHVMDLAEGHIAALEHRNFGENYKVYNLGTGVGYSVLDVINTFKRCTGIDIPYCFKPRRVGDIAECWSDPSLAFLELGWSSRYDLDTMIIDSWRWQKNNPKGYK
ncbi:UDP-glucose 4-epimerase GalE [Escherichia coli]